MSGSKDYRLLIPALALWLGSFLVTQYDSLNIPLWAVVVLVCVSIGCFSIVVTLLHQPCAITCVLVVIIAFIIGLSTSAMARARTMFDSAVSLSQSRSTHGQVVFQVTSPVTASSMRSVACQAQVRLHSVQAHNIEQVSRVQAIALISQTMCTSLQRSGVYRADATLQPAQYGHMPVWVHLDENGALHTVRKPNAFMRAIAHMQQAFFAQCVSLSDQASILVPGLTLGVLGQDIIVNAPQESHVDTQYAQQLETQCKQAGIIHLMAVSGGHYALILAVCKRWGSRLKMRRQMRAIIMTGSVICLTLLLMPSMSVHRACVMSIITCAACAKGRRKQVISALSWTIIIIISYDASAAVDAGFALSCASVLGIALWARPISTWLARIVPHSIASAMATSIAAQCWSAPIQILLTPSIPMYALAANLMVNPCMDIATLLGLAALLIAWIWPMLASVLLHCCGCCTQVIAVTAQWFGSSSHASLPWAQGILGASLIIMIELCCMAITMLIRQAATIRHQQQLAQYHTPLQQRLKQWWIDTWQLISLCRWSTRAHDQER